MAPERSEEISDIRLSFIFSEAQISYRCHLMKNGNLRGFNTAAGLSVVPSNQGNIIITQPAFTFTLSLLALVSFFVVEINPHALQVSGTKETCTKALHYKSGFTCA